MNLRHSYSEADAIFQALGDPTRRALLAELVRKPASVSELARKLDITKTAVGQHLAMLERCSLARSRKTGRVRTCEFDPEGLRVIADWIDFHRAEWAGRLDRLGSILADE